MVLIIFLVTNNLFAQADSSKLYFIRDFRISGIKDTLDNDILKRKKFIYKDLNRINIMNDTFEFASADKKNVYRLSSDKIKKISIRDGSYLWPAAGYSALAGFGLGFLLGVVPKGKGSGHPSFYLDGSSRLGLGFGIVLGLTFGIIGGLFGAATPYYIDIDLTKNGMNDNDAELRKIINKYKSE